MAYDKAEIEVINIRKGLSFFSDNKSFKTENDFIENLIPKLYTIIKAMYGLELESYKKEHSFYMQDFDLPTQRCDIFVKTKEQVNIIIECKNPTHDSQEMATAFGQMIGYSLIKDVLNKPTKILLATSSLKFHHLKQLKKFNLDFDIVLNNKETSAFILHNEL
jgi:hypothetical protein